MTKDIENEDFEVLTEEECRQVVGGITITPLDFPGKGTFWDGVKMQLDYKNSSEAIWDSISNKSFA